MEVNYLHSYSFREFVDNKIIQRQDGHNKCVRRHQGPHLGYATDHGLAAHKCVYLEGSIRLILPTPLHRFLSQTLRVARWNQWVLLYIEKEKVIQMKVDQGAIFKR